MQQSEMLLNLCMFSLRKTMLIFHLTFQYLQMTSEMILSLRRIARLEEFDSDLLLEPLLLQVKPIWLDRNGATIGNALSPSISDPRISCIGPSAKGWCMRGRQVTSIAVRCDLTRAVPLTEQDRA